MDERFNDGTKMPFGWFGEGWKIDDGKTFQLVNTGTSALQLYAMSSDPTFYTLNQQMFNIAAGESATVDVTFNFNQETLGAHQAALVLTPTNCQIAMQMVYLSAYITYENSWSEDFEPEFLVEEGETVALPADWSTTGWEIIKGGGMDMMAMMGMGGGEKSWAPHTDSDAYELITPSNVSDASVPDALNIFYDADIPTPTTTPTGINPIIQTIEADGSTRYFDMQGRLLNGKPNQGFYIERSAEGRSQDKNGKKLVTE